MTLLLPKSPRMEDRAYLDSAPGRACEACGIEDETVVGCHIRAGQGGGMSRKPDDWRVVFMCGRCHADQEAHPGKEWWFDHILIPWRRRLYERWRRHD